MKKLKNHKNMAKNKLIKNVTIDELAVIINKGFDGQMDYLKKNFENINEKFATKDDLKNLVTKQDLNEIKKDVKYIKDNLDDAGKLGQRVDYIGNVLAIKKN